MKLRLCVVVASLAFASVQIATSQTLYLGLHEEHALPSQVAQTEATQRDFVQFLAAHRSAIPNIPAMSVFQGDDLTYTSVVPMKDLNSLSGLYADLEGLAVGPDGSRFQEIFGRGWTTISHYQEAVLRYDAGLSYVPAKPRRSEADLRFYRVDLYYLKPGTEQEATRIAAAFRDLARRKNVDLGWEIYWPVIGTEMPLLLVRAGGSDQADWLAADAAFRSALGEEGRQLFAQAYDISRKVEHRNTWFRPDLSLPPAGR
jgi:hypothetical protein